MSEFNCRMKVNTPGPVSETKRKNQLRQSMADDDSSDESEENCFGQPDGWDTDDEFESINNNRYNRRNSRRLTRYKKRRKSTRHSPTTNHLSTSGQKTLRASTVETSVSLRKPTEDETILLSVSNQGVQDVLELISATTPSTY